LNILVTGHKGFIGSNIFNQLSKTHAVEGYEYYEGWPLEDVAKYDWVVHCGAISSTTEKDVEKVMRQNYDFTVNLLKNCEKASTNIQISSTANLYGNVNGYIPLNESAEVLPVSPYAWSKYLLDRYVSSNKFNILVQTFRYFNVYGTGEDNKGDQASPVHKFTQQAIWNKEITLFSNSKECKRDFVCVSDIVDVQEQMLSKQVSGVYNIGTCNPQDFEKIALLIKKKYPGTVLRYIQMPESLKGQYQYFTCADNRKISNILNKTTWIQIEDYINEMDNS